MKIAIMQPYLFPYLGYYQLVNAVDQFIFFDDVHYINKGWINRNQLWGKPDAYKFSVPLKGASQNRIIKDIELDAFDKWSCKFLKTVETTYKKAAFFEPTFAFLQHFFKSKNYNSINQLACDSIKAVSDLLQIDTVFSNAQSYQYKLSNSLNGEDKVLSLCSLTNANQYINSKNGEALYNKDRFQLKGIQLNFIHMNEVTYQQFEEKTFLPCLSIIDVMMFNSLETTQDLLNKYSLS